MAIRPNEMPEQVEMTIRLALDACCFYLNDDFKVPGLPRSEDIERAIDWMQSYGNFMFFPEVGYCRKLNRFAETGERVRENE